MLHNNFCLALWHLPAASTAASSASASASSPAAAPMASAAATASAATSASAPPSSISASAAATSAKPSTDASGRPDHKERSHLQPGSRRTPTPISEDADAVLLAFTYPRYRIYSIARSPDGRFVAVGQSFFLTIRCKLLSCFRVGYNSNAI